MHRMNICIDILRLCTNPRAGGALAVPLALFQSAIKKKPSVAIQHAIQSQSSCSSANGIASQQEPGVAIQHAIESQTSSSGASGAAAQLDSVNDPAITNLVADIVSFGRCTKRHLSAQSKEDQEENNFC